MSILSDDSPVVQIHLSKGHMATLSECDAELALYKWSARICPTGVVHAFCQRGSKGQRKTVYLHREVMARILGRPLERSEYIDHIDMDGTNNQRSNLRIATHGQNLANRGKTSKNTSGYKGVYWYKIYGNWRAEIKADGKSKSLGYFSSKHDAAEAYNRAAILAHGEFARLNVIEKSEE